MEQEINITIRLDLAIGKVNLNEIVYELEKLQKPLMLKILEEILHSYDDLICQRLSQTKLYPSKARKGLGRHVRRADPEGRFCRGRKIRKRGYRRRRIKKHIWKAGYALPCGRVLYLWGSLCACAECLESGTLCSKRGQF